MLNNGGDTFQGSLPFSYNSKWMERNVLDYFASLWNARWPHRESDKESYWGYVLSMGSTEAFTHCGLLVMFYQVLQQRLFRIQSHTTLLHLSTEFLLSSSLATATTVCTNVATLSASPHLTVWVESNIRERTLWEKGWRPGVPCSGGDSGPGTIDIDALEKLVYFFSSRGHPTVVVFNYGSTIKGSCDDVKAAGERGSCSAEEQHVPANIS